jgi:hypothetical protein
MMDLRMLSTRVVVVVAGLGTVLAAGGARASDEVDPDGAQPLTGKPARVSGTSSIVIKHYGADTVVSRERNVTFRLFRGFTPMLLLREETDVEDLVPWKGEGFARASVDITARVVGTDGQVGGVRYRVHEVGESATLYQTLYVVSMEGCCDSQDGHAIYSAETGKRLMYTTGSTAFGAFERLPASTSGSWVGVYVANSVYDDSVFTRGSDYLAVVTYASSSAPLMRAGVARVSVGPNSSPFFDRLEVRTRPGKDGADPSVTLHLQFDDDVSVDLPVTNDGLDVAHATSSYQLAVRKVPLEGRL